jgi:hypothetical protein
MEADIRASGHNRASGRIGRDRVGDVGAMRGTIIAPGPDDAFLGKRFRTPAASAFRNAA